MSSESDYRSIVENLDESIVRLDQNHKVTYANPTACRLVGKSLCELLGFSFFTVFPAEKFGMDTDFFTPKDPSGYFGRVEVCFAARWYDWSVRKCNNDDGTTSFFLVVGRDITETKLREQRLAESDERHRQFIENQPVGMFRSRLEGDGRMIIANSTAAEMFCYPSREAFLDIKVLDIYHSQEQREKLLQVLIEKEKIVDVELEGKRRDGSNMVASLSLQLVRNSEGHPVEADGTILDITERKKDEESLRVFKFIFDRAALGIYRLEADGTILDVNDQAAQMLGYTRDEMIGMSLWDIDPEVTPESWSSMWQIAIGKGQEVFERTHRRKDGSTIPVEINSNFLEYRGHHFSISFATDITDRKRTETELKKQEHQHRLAQRIAQLGHWERFMDSDQVVWSDEVYRIYEFDKKVTDNLYQPAIECVHPDDRLLIKDAVARALKSGSELDLVHRIILPGERIKYLHVRAHPEYTDDGKPYKIIGTLQDITARREAEIEKEKVEKQLLQVQKLEAIGTLAGGIAHDFNNILTSIIGFTQIAMNRTGQDHKAWKSLDMVLKAGIRARELVAHILTFSRQNEQIFEVVPVREIIREVVELLRASIPANIEIRTEIGIDCCAVLGVPIQIHQIMVNLCTNAHHAIGDCNGRITISLQESELTPDEFIEDDDLKPGRYAKLTVSDTGQGMDQATMAKVFDPYFTTKQKGERTGLGLSVVHGIVKKHGGYIRVFSEPGEGTTFSIYLPCTKEQKTDSVHIAEHDFYDGSEQIVIVDDEEPITELLAEMLGRLGYKVAVFTEPGTALDEILSGEEVIDLVITDLTMPQMDGVTLARAIRKAGLLIPIVIQTGFSENLDMDKLKDAGIEALIKKPILEVELARCVRTVLDRRGEKDM